VALVITDGSEELSASFTRVTKISELGIMLAVTNAAKKYYLVTLMMGVLRSSETLVITRAAQA
jgi:hypothetical protein